MEIYSQETDTALKVAIAANLQAIRANVERLESITFPELVQLHPTMHGFMLHLVGTDHLPDLAIYMREEEVDLVYSYIHPMIYKHLTITDYQRCKITKIRQSDVEAREKHKDLILDPLALVP